MRSNDSFAASSCCNVAVNKANIKFHSVGELRDPQSVSGNTSTIG